MYNRTIASCVLVFSMGLAALNLNSGCGGSVRCDTCDECLADGWDRHQLKFVGGNGKLDTEAGRQCCIAACGDKETPPDFGIASSPDLKTTGFGCQAAIAGCDKYNRDCWSDQKNFSGGKADPVKVLSCQVGKDVVLFGSIVTPNGKAQYSAVLACMAGQCPKGGVITFTDKNGITINIGFDSSFACINELVRGNNNACANQLATCNDDGDYSIPMAQAPVPGGGGSTSSVTQEVCIDIPAWPSTQPLPGDNGIVLIGDIQVDLAHGGVACQYLPVTTGIVN